MKRDRRKILQRTKGILGDDIGHFTIRTFLKDGRIITRQIYARSELAAIRRSKKLDAIDAAMPNVRPVFHPSMLKVGD